MESNENLVVAKSIEPGKEYRILDSKGNSMTMEASGGWVLSEQINRHKKTQAWTFMDATNGTWSVFSVADGNCRFTLVAGARAWIAARETGGGDDSRFSFLPIKDKPGYFHIIEKKWAEPIRLEGDHYVRHNADKPYPPTYEFKLVEFER